MTEPLESEVGDIVDLLADKKRSEALDKINDYLYAKASDVIDTYKQSVATSYFRREVGATQVLRYNGPSVVLGDYKGCIPFEEVGKTWAI